MPISQSIRGTLSCSAVAPSASSPIAAREGVRPQGASPRRALLRGEGPQGGTALSVARRVAGTLAAAGALLLVPFVLATAQGGGGGGNQGGSATPPAASANLKRSADRDDPINFLLEKKKLLLIDRALEDSLKSFRKEMQHYQDVVYKDLDKAATRKEQGQLPGPVLIASLTKDSEERVKDIQSAYRDRARLLLSERQRAQVDSLQAVWKRE